MTPLSHSSELDPLAAELAPVIDAHAGEHPLVSFYSDDTGPAMTWTYARLVVELFIDAQAVASIHSHEHGSIAIDVRSFKQGMELLRRTEGLRQQQPWPYVRLS